MRSLLWTGSPYALLLAGTLAVNCSVPQSLTRAASPADLQRLLSAEADGLAVDRSAAVQTATDDPAAHWHAGEVLLEGQWIKLEQLSSEHTSEPLRRYAELRDRTELDAQGHRKLAAWADKHDLAEIADAHRRAILTAQPGDQQTREALGHKNVGGVWFTPEEMAEATADEKARVEALKRWMPKVRKLVAALESSDTKRRLAGLEELKSIDTDAAVALRYAALQVGEDSAAAIVAALGRMRSEEACNSLVHLALADPAGKAGRAAVEALKAYSPHFYVPDLLAMLHSPTQVRSQVLRSRNGDVMLEHIYVSETRDQKQEHAVRKLISMNGSQPAISTTDAIPGSLFGLKNQLQNRPQVEVGDSDMVRSLSVRGKFGSRSIASSVHSKTADLALSSLTELAAERGEQAANSGDHLRSDLSSRAALVLSNVSLLPASAPAEEFWSWWPQYNERGTGVKPVRRTSVDDYNNPVVLSTDVFATPPCSCLVPGTPVQTACGLRPVESIEVGDLLPAVDVQTGEVSLKPVSLRSSRTAERTYVIRTTGGGEIEATGGHYWWAAGEGWVRSRELKPGMLIRTADSSAEVASLEVIETPREVFNLVVDDSHTYFVGEERWLSWDVTELEPTLLRAPGFRPGQYAAAQ